MESKKSLVETTLSEFLSANSLDSSDMFADEVVLDYLISILEELGDSQYNSEENASVDQFCELMEAYIPGFGEIDRTKVYEWLFSLSSKISNKKANDSGDQSVPLSVQLTRFSAVVGVSSMTRQDSKDTFVSEGSSKDALELNSKVQHLLEMFPVTCSMEAIHCLMLSNGDVAEAAQLVLHRQETGSSITALDGTKKFSQGIDNRILNDQEIRDQLIQRYAYVDEEEDKRVHRPLTPKTGPKKMIRYLEGKVVSTKGERFTEVKDEETVEMKRTYVNLKPAKKYRFH